MVLDELSVSRRRKEFEELQEFKEDGRVNLSDMAAVNAHAQSITEGSLPDAPRSGFRI